MKWDERYNVEEYIYGTAANDFLTENFGAIPKGDVLCIAEGEGRNSIFLAQQGYTVTAVDSSVVALEKAEKLARDNNVDIACVQADLEQYDFGTQKWSGIVSIFCPLPSALRRQIHQKAVNALKSDGVFLLEAYTPDQLKHGTGGGKDADCMTTKSSLEIEFSDLDIRHLKELEREVIEGSYHTGLAAVVQMVAVKTQ